MNLLLYIGCHRQPMYSDPALGTEGSLCIAHQFTYAGNSLIRSNVPYLLLYHIFSLQNGNPNMFGVGNAAQARGTQQPQSQALNSSQPNLRAQVPPNIMPPQVGSYFATKLLTADLIST